MYRYTMSTKTLKDHLHEIIFEAETPSGRFFDIVLLWAIIISVLAVVLESVSELRANFSELFFVIEWTFTVLFTLEYALRIFSVRKPLGYIFSFYGLVDLLSLIPSYIGIFFAGTNSLRVIRAIRLLRIFRIFKLARYLGATSNLKTALYASRAKIVVFTCSVLSLALIMGTIMYLIEGEANGFTSIPKSIYWSIVTMTTVGYGDIAPQTTLGQMLASIVMILGYAIIAVPTGIVSVELANASKNQANSVSCPSCSAEGHDSNAVYCKFCSEKL